MIAETLPDEIAELAAQLPLPILEGLRNYGIHHVPTGSFLAAVLENNFMEAVGRADEGSLAAIRPIARFVYNCLPSPCWGSREKVDEWLKVRVA